MGKVKNLAWLGCLPFVTAAKTAEDFERIGRHIAQSVIYYEPEGATEAVWRSAVDDLRKAVLRDQAAAWKWIDKHLPAIARAVPEKHQPAFIEGMKKAGVKV